ncbi:hypothetical protein HC761_01135, partial [bacterium]|nr:hypothetical protein [bacterium]
EVPASPEPEEAWFRGNGELVLLANRPGESTTQAAFSIRRFNARGAAIASEMIQAAALVELPAAFADKPRYARRDDDIIVVNANGTQSQSVVDQSIRWQRPEAAIFGDFNQRRLVLRDQNSTLLMLDQSSGAELRRLPFSSFRLTGLWSAVDGVTIIRTDNDPWLWLADASTQALRLDGADGRVALEPRSLGATYQHQHYRRAAVQWCASPESAARSAEL